MPLVPDVKNCDISVKRAIQGLSNKLGYTSNPVFNSFHITNIVAATPSTLNGKLTVGSFSLPIDVTSTRQYGFELHFSGNNYDVTGIRSRAQLVTTDTSATAQGALLQAANNDGINVGVLNGALIEAIGKSDANAATISTMRGCLVNTEWGDYDTITNLKTLHIRTHSRNAAGAGSFGTGYGIYIENEAVGGNGQAYDAGIYFKGTNLSAGNKAFTYGIDFSGGTYGTAEMLIGNAKIASSSNSLIIQSIIDSTTFFQVNDKDGNVIAAIDTVNNKLEMSGSGAVLLLPQESTAAEPTLAFGSLKRVGFYSTTNLNLFIALGAAAAFKFENSGLRMTGTVNGARFQRESPTATNPVFTFEADTDTGIGRGGEDILSLIAGGVNGLNIVETGGISNVGFGGELDPETLIELTHANPDRTVHCSTDTNADNGRKIVEYWKGEKADTTEFRQATVTVSHVGTGDDYKSKYVIATHDAASAVDTVTDALTIDDTQLATFAGAINVTGAITGGSFTGLVIGTDVQAWDTQLDDIAALAVTNSNFIVGDGTNWVAESGATVRTSLGLTIGTNVLAQQAIGIADDNLLEVDDADAADNDYAKFTTNGLEGRSIAEVWSDLAETTRTINLLQSDNTAAKQAKIDAVGKYIPVGVIITFQFETGGTHTETDQLLFSGFFGGGYVYIQGNTAEANATILHTTQDTIIDVSGETTIKALYISNNSVQILVRNLRIELPNYAGSWGVLVLSCSFLAQVHYNYILGAGTTNNVRGIESEYCTIVYASKNYVSNLKYGFVGTMGQLLSSGNDETGTDPLYGLYARAGGIISKSSTQPTGSTADELTDSGGLFI